MEFFHNKTHVDFIGWRFLPIGMSVLIIVGSLLLFLAKGINYGIEFTGGALVQVTFQKPTTLAEVRKSLDKQNLSAEIQSVEGRPTFILRQKGVEESVEKLSAKLVSALQAENPGNPLTVDRKEYIGPAIGRDLKQRTLWAIGLSLLGIIIYIAFRFSNPVWGVAGVIALFHDVIGTAGIFALTGKEVDLLIVSALLTIAGYSISDTIVIFDRMREMSGLMRKEPLEKVINVAINDTLSRTVITVLVVQLVCLILLFFGGEVIHNFALAMVVGNFLGSYSSIAVAAPLVYDWNRLNKKR